MLVDFFFSTHNVDASTFSRVTKHPIIPVIVKNEHMWNLSEQPEKFSDWRVSYGSVSDPDPEALKKILNVKKNFYFLQHSWTYRYTVSETLSYGSQCGGARRYWLKAFKGTVSRDLYLQSFSHKKNLREIETISENTSANKYRPLKIQRKSPGICRYCTKNLQ